MRKYSHVVFFCKNPKLGEPHFTAFNPKKDCKIEGNFDIKKPIDDSTRFLEQKVIFGNEVFYCNIFARVESGMRVEELNKKLNNPETKFNNTVGSVAARYMNTVHSFAPRILKGHSYDDLQKKSPSEPPVSVLPDAKISREYQSVSTEPEEEIHMKKLQSKSRSLVIQI